MSELSIIIPTYNRAGRLRTCLEALAAQTQPTGDFEVIVVVDGSTDGTAGMLAKLNLPFSLTVLHQANSGQQIARNYGAAHARGRYYLFLDDDIIAEPQLVAEHLRLHRQHERVAGIGQMTLDVGEADWFTKRVAEGWREHYRQLNQPGRRPSWPDAYGGNLSVSRADFMAAGGFAPDLRRSHDIEFAFRLEQHGLTFVYLPRATGRQEEHKRARDLFADAARSGAAWVTLCRRHPAMLPELLGPLGDTSAREALLRELFWRCGLSPWLLAWLGAFLARSAWGQKWYRFLFSYGYWRGVRQATGDGDTWQQMVRGVPILMYHAFGRPGERAGQFVLPLRQFERQMAWLKRLNYHVLSLEDYLDFRRRHCLPPPRAVVITIDDGYAEIAGDVCPILRRYGFPATVFLVSGKVGGCNDWSEDQALNGRPLLSWSDVQEMSHAGLDFGAHTRSHAVLTEIPAEQVGDEIAGSKTDLERALQKPVHAFAYPHGAFDEQLQAAVRRAGFWGGCTVEGGVNSWSTPLTALRRLEVEGTWSLLRFLFVLRLGGRL
jgi:glycosyltransferase involved in cell wall biosynthesis